MPAPTLLYFSRKQLKRKTRTENEKALITGITGQDGSYLAEFLLEKGMKCMD